MVSGFTIVQGVLQSVVVQFLFSDRSQNMTWQDQKRKSELLGFGFEFFIIGFFNFFQFLTY